MWKVCASYPGSSCTYPPSTPPPVSWPHFSPQPARQIGHELCRVACTGPTPGFDPVGSLLKSSWVKERQAKRQQARWRPAALQTPQGQAPRSSAKAGPGRAPAGQHQARERAMAAQQARTKQPSAAGQQPLVTRRCVLHSSKRGCLGLEDMCYSAGRLCHTQSNA